MIKPVKMCAAIAIPNKKGHFSFATEEIAANPTFMPQWILVAFDEHNYIINLKNMRLYYAFRASRYHLATAPTPMFFKHHRIKDPLLYDRIIDAIMPSSDA